MGSVPRSRARQLDRRESARDGVVQQTIHELNHDLPHPWVPPPDNAPPVELFGIRTIFRFSLRWAMLLIVLALAGFQLSLFFVVPKNIFSSTKNTRRNVTSHRVKAMNATGGKFSFVHISKCAGATWIRILHKMLKLDVYPQRESGNEHSVWYQNKLCPNADYHLTSLRSPRHHVFSLFTECKYDEWGILTTETTAFPRSGNDASSDESDFNLWLDHFLPMGPEKKDYYNCYHPANYQSRALVSHQKSPQGVNEDQFESNATDAYHTYWEMDFVAITEFVHESLCLFYYRLGNSAPPTALSHLNDKCHCREHAEEHNVIHVMHHKNGHRSSLRDLPEIILSKVEELTAIDSLIYNMALNEFMTEIAWLESSSALGRRVLCNDVLKKLEPELSYIVAQNGQNLNITQLYMEAVGSITL